MRLPLLFVCCFFLCGAAWAQAQSVHEEQNAFYRSLGLQTEADFDRFNGYSPSALPARTAQTQYTLQKKIFGFNPYWVGTAFNSYDYSLLSTVAYFSYEVNPQTGSYNSIYAWKTTDLVPTAQAKGVKVVLAVTNFGSTANTTLLNNPRAKQTLVDSLIALVKLRKADGVNIDFETVPAATRDSLSKFMRDLSVKMKAALPGSVLSIDLPAVDWSNAFDVKAMEPFVDDFLIMGYDYYYSGSTKAGPVAPLNGSSLFGNLSISKSVDDYLDKGIPAAKLILAVPYYGRNWATVSDQPGAATSGTVASASRLFSVAKNEARQHGRRWSVEAATPYYVYQQNGQWNQTWYDDFESLSLKYKTANAKRLGGAGIWALSYDGTEPDLKNALIYHFTDAPPLTSLLPPPPSELVEIYPNPSTRQQGATLRGSVSSFYKLTDVLGNTLLSGQIAGESTLDLSGLLPGLYLLNIQQPSGWTTRKLIITH